MIANGTIKPTLLDLVAAEQRLRLVSAVKRVIPASLLPAVAWRWDRLDTSTMGHQLTIRIKGGEDSEEPNRSRRIWCRWVARWCPNRHTLERWEQVPAFRQGPQLHWAVCGELAVHYFQTLDQAIQMAQAL